MTEDARRTLLVEKLRRKFKDGVIDTIVSRGEVTHLVKKEAFREMCEFLKNVCCLFYVLCENPKKKLMGKIPLNYKFNIFLNTIYFNIPISNYSSCYITLRII